MTQTPDPADDAPLMVRVDGLGKKFAKELRRSLRYGVADIMRELFCISPAGERLRPSEFWALHNVSFSIKKGESVGLIGRNGAGKTTLLRLIAGLIKPDVGSIEVNGRLGAMIALGAGFHPALTGRENVYINAAVLGIGEREIAKQLDDIVAFAELGDFIDAPVQSYSSGMVVRLGFAVATAIRPDVLLLDEVLAVGDTQFRAKCYRRVGELMKQSTVIYVGHNLIELGRICDRALVLSDGGIAFDGSVPDAVNFFLEHHNPQDTATETFEKVFDPRFTLHQIRIAPQSIRSWDPVTVNVDYTCEADIALGRVRCQWRRPDGSTVADYDSVGAGHRYELTAGTGTLSLPLGPMPLTSGEYHLGMALSDPDELVIMHTLGHGTLTVEGRYTAAGAIELPTPGS